VIIFINGSFGIGKTTVARLLAAHLPNSAVFDPEPVGLLLSRLALLLPLAERTDDFQDLVSWRRTSIRAISLALRFRKTVIVPMAFSNVSYLGEFLSHFRDRAIPTHHFCLTAPHRVVLARLHARERRRGPDQWQLRRSAECCDVHGAPEFAEHIPTADHSALEVANEVLGRIHRGADGPSAARVADSAASARSGRRSA
jgi:thymidylate kinase